MKFGIDKSVGILYTAGANGNVYNLAVGNIKTVIIWITVINKSHPQECIVRK